MQGGDILSENDQLVQNAARGDDQAFLKLIQLYKIDLYKMALAFLRNEEEVLEVIQGLHHSPFKTTKRSHVSRNFLLPNLD
jgi:hypothetical protein